MVYVTKHCFSSIGIRTSRKCPFKFDHINTCPKILKKMDNLQLSFKNTEVFFDLFCNDKEIHVKEIYDLNFSAESINEISIIILINNEAKDKDTEYEDFSTDNLIISGITFELRYITLHTTINFNEVSYMRHGNEFMSWWKAERPHKLPIHSEFPKVQTNNIHIAVYVRLELPQVGEARDAFITYIGGQSHVFCSEHKIPLIVERESRFVCMHRNDNGDPCKQKAYFGCPSMLCTVKICKTCFHKQYSRNKKTYVSVGNNSCNEQMLCAFCDSESESVSSSIKKEVEEESVALMLDDLDVEENETCFDKLVIPNNNYLDDDEDSNDDNSDNEDFVIPTTNIGENGITIGTYEDDNKYISGHVILNQCGSLLSRTDNHIKSYKSQKHFLQRLASTIEGETIPLLYPEAMMFPSIFWKLLDSRSKSFPGALPSSLLAKPISQDGFASIKSHVNVRLTSSFCSSSTNPTYISFLFDILSNLLLNSTDSRIILHRGLTCCDGNIGISTKANKDSPLHDSIDSKQIVKNLCASQKYVPMTFFLTFTVNQLEHFGVREIKRWIDGSKWKQFYDNFNDLSYEEKEEVKNGLEQAAAPILLRNWMETRIFLIDYIYGSKSSPYHPVKGIFSRDEYQKDKGNLPHIHLILSVDMDKISEEKKTKLNDLIRASICSIRTYDEVQELINEGVFSSWEDVNELNDLGRKILSHKCDERCKRRVNDGDDPDNFRCRKLNNLRISPNNTKNSYISIETKRSEDCIDRLIQIGLAEPITANIYGVKSKFRSYHSYFHPMRHIPPTNPNDDFNISPVEGYTFSICRSMQNIQNLTHTNGLNRYVCKYIGKIDEQNRILISSHPYKQNCLVNKSSFLHNTKITSSAINENKYFSKQRDKKHPRGRAITLMEMLQIMLSYPQVRTDMIFEIICTLPLEQRPGIEKSIKIPTTDFINEKYNLIDEDDNEEQPDGLDTSILIQKIRNDLKFPSERQLRQEELLMLQGTFSSKVSIDKITKFSLRPPELRDIIRKVEHYYRWFYIVPKQLNQEEMLEGLNANVRRTLWIDSLQNQIQLRKNALPELIEFVSRKFVLQNSSSHIKNTIEWFQRIYFLSLEDNQRFQKDIEDWNFICKNLLYVNEEKHLPIPVFSYVRPTLGTRFILHLLLSMGEFETEIDLLLHKDLKESLRYAKLIGPSNTAEKLQEYSDNLLKMFIEEQLVFYPNSSKVIDSWIVAAGELLDGVIVRNEIPITDMPPVLQTQIESKDEVRICLLLQQMKKDLIEATSKELQHVLTLYNIPSINELENATIEYPVNWEALNNFKKSTYQSESSYVEQRECLKVGIEAIDSYANGTQQTCFTKCVIIAGSPGSGKSFLEMYLAIYGLTKGLNCAITAVMSKRAIQLGGVHLHKLFALPGHNKLTLYRLAEIAIISLKSKADKYFLLKTLHILFIDEIGQVSSELLGTLDIILRKIRNNDIFFGGLLIISTLDQKQLPPVRGKPFLTSPHILSCFKSYILKNSVRAHNDNDFSRLQYIARMSPRSYIENPNLLNTFKKLLEKCCTFVPSWTADIITPDVHRVYGKKHPAREACDAYVQQVKSKLNISEYIESKSQDVQLTYNSHQEWQTASPRTSTYLNHIVKEPQTLLFFKGAKFIFTYNEDGKFSQSQIGLLLQKPTQSDVKKFKRIPILVSPPGIKDAKYDPHKSEQCYLDEGWTKFKVGVCREVTHSVEGNIKAQRKQYGLKPNVTSTVHASMGDTLHKVATEVSLEDSHYMLWDKAQVIVLLSRTRRGKDLIFVGNKRSTIKALANLIKGTSQWADYMEQVLHIISENGDTEQAKISYFSFTSYPFRMRDVNLPICNTGYVYLLVSTKDHNQTYIGQTKHIQTRLKQHNSGYGSTYTAALKYRPWFLISFICGFDNNLNQMLYVESRWKKVRSQSIQLGQRDPKVIAMRSQQIIDDISKHLKNNLRLILLFRED